MISNSNNNYVYWILTIIFLLLTPLREAVILLMPFIYFVSTKLFHLKTNRRVLFTFIIFVMSSISGILNRTTDVANILLSWWVIFPLLILFFSKPNFNRRTKFIKLFSNYFIRYSTYILLAVDFLGFIARFFIFKTEDEFGWAYGRHFAYVDGLAIVNALFFIFYLSHVVTLKNNLKSNIIYMSLFFVSTMFCFSNLVFMCLLIALTVYFVTRLRLRILIYVLFITLLSGYVFVKVSQSNVLYITNTLNKLNTAENDKDYGDFRKILMVLNFSNYASANPITAIFFGVGPGGYNSRIAFMLNSDANNIFTKIMGKHMPMYHSSDIYPLWSKTFLDINSFNDGSRNKPFSSILSLTAEYGLFFAIFFILYWIVMIIKYFKNSKENHLYIFLYVSNIFMILNLFVNQWLESSEFLLFIFLQYVALIKINLYDTKKNTLLLVE